MKFPIVMPKVGLTMTEGKIVEWKKKTNEKVEKGDILFLFETEKVTVEAEAQQGGYLVSIQAQVDEVVPVGQQVGMIAEQLGEQVDAVAEPPPSVAEPVAITAPAKIQQRSEKIRATPLAKRLARERGVDLASLANPEGGGRVRMKDVETAAVEPSASSQATASVVGAEKAPASASAGRLVKPSGMRKVIAEKMLASKTETAQTYMVASIEAGQLVESRKQLAKYMEKAAGVRPTITDVVMKLCAWAIGKHPIINTRWTPEGILWLDGVHMGMAMALDEGLIVPVITDIDKKSMIDIAKQRLDLVERGKAGRLTPDEMRGSTFTVSSLGMFGVEEFTAIINQPESAILAVGAIVDKPVAIGGVVTVRPIMKITLSYDHRVIDGAQAAAFLKTLKEIAESPMLALA